jgi:hypothetical protein
VGGIKLDGCLRDDLFPNLAQKILDHNLTAVTANIWDYQWAEFKSGPVGPDFPSAYHLCFLSCVDSLAYWSMSVANSEPVALFFARQQEHGDRALESYNMVKDDFWWSRFLGPIVFDDPETYPGLQAADLLAYEMYQMARSHRAGASAPSRRGHQKFSDGNLPIIGNFIDTKIFTESWSQMQSYKEYKRTHIDIDLDLTLEEIQNLSPDDLTKILNRLSAK